MSLRRFSCVLLAGALCVVPVAARADSDPRLAARLDAETSAAVGKLVDDARATGIPSDPLVAKALEGASKGAPGPRIVEAVRQYAMALDAARGALGRDSREAEIVAGAGAVLAGVAPDSLTRLRAARPGVSLVVPLVVMADLLARKVPAGDASGTILAASRAGARDADLLLLRERVERDIRAGSSPQSAALARGRAMLQSGTRGLTGPPPGGPSPGGHP